MTKILWKRKKGFQESSDLVDRSLPTWAKNDLPTLITGLNVSIAIEMNMWEEDWAEYLAISHSAAILAALPLPAELAVRYDGAKSTTIAFHSKQRPLCQGTSVRPSRQKSVWGIRPDGSLWDDSRGPIGTGESMSEHQNVQMVVTSLSADNWQRESMEHWRSEVVTANAKKAESASDVTRRMPRMPSLPCLTGNNNNNNITGIFLLRRLHRNEGDRVANKLWPEVHYKIN